MTLGKTNNSSNEVIWEGLFPIFCLFLSFYQLIWNLFHLSICPRILANNFCKRKIKFDFLSCFVTISLKILRIFLRSLHNIFEYCPANIYLFKSNNRNSRKRCEVYSKLTIKTTERPYWCHSGVFIVNFEHISHLFLVFLFLTFSRKIFGGC